MLLLKSSKQPAPLWCHIDLWHTSLLALEALRCSLQAPASYMSASRHGDEPATAVGAAARVSLLLLPEPCQTRCAITMPSARQPVRQAVAAAMLTRARFGAQMVAGVAFTPTDIIKERLQACPHIAGSFPAEPFRFGVPGLQEQSHKVSVVDVCCMCVSGRVVSPLLHIS